MGLFVKIWCGCFGTLTILCVFCMWAIEIDVLDSIQVILKIFYLRRRVVNKADAPLYSALLKRR